MIYTAFEIVGFLEIKQTSQSEELDSARLHFKLLIIDLFILKSTYGFLHQMADTLQDEPLPDQDLYQ